MLKDPACSAALEDWFRSLPQRNETGGNEESDDDEQIVVGFFYVLFVQVFQTSIFDILLYVKSDEYFKQILFSYFGMERCRIRLINIIPIFFQF